MARLFFAKMNRPDQVEKKEYRSNDLGVYGSIQKNDYVLVKLEKETHPASVKRLWRLKSIDEINSEYKYKASFEEICQFKPIPLLTIEALDLFVLNKNLLNQCNKQVKTLSFYQLSLTDETKFNELVTTPKKFMEYVDNSNHYRKVVKAESKDQLDAASINVQFYKDGDNWMLFDASFIGDDLKKNYDSTQFELFEKYGKKGTNTAKEKMYSFLAGFDSIDVPLMGLWDLFCGTVKENPDTQIGRRTSYKRDAFIEYCVKNGVARAADQYESGLRSMEKELSVNADDEFESDACKTLQHTVSNYVNQYDENQVGNRRNWIVYLKKFVEYKTASMEKEIYSETQEDHVNVNTPYDYSRAKHCGTNKVFYGTPGCGKSYYVQNVILPQEGIDTNNSVFRTTFYQDYSNTDFVGQVLPQVDESGKVEYEFNPGPFTLALKCAIDNPDEKVALIIEELNRGNAPSIFGDLFQLLDRENGTSMYPIKNTNIESYLKKHSSFDSDEIRIPANLYIYATMNTSDQNVFTLDTAFKRRWKFKLLSNDFRSDEKIAEKYVPGLQGITWKKFVITINNFIIDHATSLSAEDKQLGKYFVDEDLLLDAPDDISPDKLEEFAHKVFEYLWTDVAKYNREDWFISDVKSLYTLLYRYTDYQTVFCPKLAEDLPVYTPSEEEE